MSLPGGDPALLTRPVQTPLPVATLRQAQRSTVLAILAVAALLAALMGLTVGWLFEAWLGPPPARPVAATPRTGRPPAAPVAPDSLGPVSASGDGLRTPGYGQAAQPEAEPPVTAVPSRLHKSGG